MNNKEPELDHTNFKPLYYKNEVLHYRMEDKNRGIEIRLRPCKEGMCVAIHDRMGKILNEECTNLDRKTFADDMEFVSTGTWQAIKIANKFLEEFDDLLQHNKGAGGYPKGEQNKDSDSG